MDKRHNKKKSVSGKTKNVSKCWTYSSSNQQEIRQMSQFNEIETNKMTEEVTEQMIEDFVLGIDLGTRFSCASIWRNKRPEIITDQFGNRTIPSVVAFYKSHKLVGYNALVMKQANPANTIYDIKRIIGRRMNDTTIEQTKKLVTYELVDDESEHHNVRVQLDTKDPTLQHKLIYRPEEICSHILFEIKKLAQNYLKKNVTKAVITVPAYFNDAQRQATLDAAQIAGLEVLKIINEPTAAALAYGLVHNKWGKRGTNVIIYDLGAGTLDVSLMNINNGVFKTLAINGNSHMGGEDIDYLIMNHVMIDFRKKNRIKELIVTKLAKTKLKYAVENAKKILSTAEKAIICVDDFYCQKKLYYVLTREKMEAICHHLFIMCVKPIQDVLESAGMTKQEIDEVVLVGGSTRVPKIQQLILNFFRDTKIKRLTTSLNPDEVVSTGAAIYGYIITHNDDPFTENLMLLDVTPLSLGVETLQKQMTVIIPRNTVIPTSKTKIFSTDTDDQDDVLIKIFEGERKLTKNNFHVGTFSLSGFEKGPRGYPTIKITFHVDINGILQVTAHEKRSDIQNSIRITSTWGAKGRLSKEDIDNIIREAEKNEETDTMFSIKIGLAHKIRSICTAILINLKDKDFVLTNTDRKKIRADVKENLNWLKKQELTEIPVDQLEKREERLSKTYAPLIALSNKNNMNFKDGAASINAAEIYGDDEDTEMLQQFEKINIPNDPTEYEKEEMKALKNTILDLCANIHSVVTNPVSKFTQDDINLILDYLTTVQLWVMITDTTSTMQYLAKIDEINKITEDIMKKYEEIPFEKNEQFTAKDELQLTCVTLHSSINSNYFSIKKTDMDILSEKVNETMLWLTLNQEEPESVYQEKINEINELCNKIYHSMHTMKVLENLEPPNGVNTCDNDIDTDIDSEDEDINNTKPNVPENNKIRENITDIINNMPDIPTKNRCKPKPTDVLLKIDMNKLNNISTLRYKNTEYHCR